MSDWKKIGLNIVMHIHTLCLWIKIVKVKCQGLVGPSSMFYDDEQIIDEDALLRTKGG